MQVHREQGTTPRSGSRRIPRVETEPLVPMRSPTVADTLPIDLRGLTSG